MNRFVGLGLAAVLVAGAILASGCGGSKSSGSSTSKQSRSRAAKEFSVSGRGAARGPNTVQIKLGGHRARPPLAKAKIGQVVVWTNLSGITRSIVARKGVSFRSTALGRGAKYTFRFTTPGTIHYVSTGRPRLTGTVKVVR
jgi:plastocyanin